MAGCPEKGASQRQGSFLHDVSVSIPFWHPLPKSGLLYDSECARGDVSLSQEEELSDPAVQGGARPSAVMKPTIVGTPYVTVTMNCL